MAIRAPGAKHRVEVCELKRSARSDNQESSAADHHKALEGKFKDELSLLQSQYDALKLSHAENVHALNSTYQEIAQLKKFQGPVRIVEKEIIQRVEVPVQVEVEKIVEKVVEIRQIRWDLVAGFSGLACGLGTAIGHWLF